MTITEFVEKIPLVNLMPLIIKLFSNLPELWENVPQEKKQELFNALIAAGTKAAKEYAQK